MIKLRKYITGFIIFALLGGLFVFHFIVSYKILSKTSYLIIGDFNYRINEGNEVRDIILSNCPPKERAKNLFLYFTTLKVQYHPHLFTLVNGICRALVSNKKNENLEILLASSFFFLILLISMYKIGALLYDRRTGIFLSFFTSFVPIIFSYLRIQMLDLPLAAMCTLSILFLLRTR